jgi:uncharacterized protein YecE (DUF72 family)
VGDLRRGLPDHPILVGTSGFVFRDWEGPFYPPGLPAASRLAFYARYFPALEINSSYYRVPEPRALASLVTKVPEDFEFIVKAHQDLTHAPELPEGSLPAFLGSLAPLAEAGRLHGILAQFPWRFRDQPASRERLLRLSDGLPGQRLFVEFRHASWAHEDAFRFLEREGIGYCSVDEPLLEGLMPPVARRTTDLAYVRFHGRNRQNWWGRAGGDRYDYSYRAEELGEWLGKIRELAERAEKTYVFFNNCHAGQAARSARLMMDLLQREFEGTA